MNDVSQHQDDFLPLDEALGFSEADLAANRAGQLSETQAQRLRRRDRTGLIVGNIVAIGLLGGGMWLVSGGLVGFGALLIVLGGSLFLLTRWGRGDYTAETVSGTVEIVRGQLVLDTAEYKNPNGLVTEYRVRVGDEVFVISRDAFIALSEARQSDDHPFALYYLPRLRMLLSAEPLARA